MDLWDFLSSRTPGWLDDGKNRQQMFLPIQSNLSIHSWLRKGL